MLSAVAVNAHDMHVSMLTVVKYVPLSWDVYISIRKKEGGLSLYLMSCELHVYSFNVCNIIILLKIVW